MTTPLFLLRCVQLGLSIRDLDLLTIGMVNDMYAESSNDEYKYREIATQADFDLFNTLKNRTAAPISKYGGSHNHVKYTFA